MVKYNKYLLKNGQTRWAYRGYWGKDPKTGARIAPEKQGFKTRADAKIHYERAIEKLNKHSQIIEQKNITFEQAFKKYMKFYAHTGVTISTQIKFESDTKNHILPHIGHYYLRTITVSDCQNLVNEVRKKRKDFRKILGHARAVFNYAIQEGYLNENPLNKVIIRSAKIAYKQTRVPTEENYYTPTQLIKFLEYYEKHGNFHEFVYFRLLAFSGLRRSEALALYKTDINYRDKSLLINKTLTEGRGANSTYVSNYTKTDNSSTHKFEHIVYLDNVTFEYLDQLAQKTKYVYGNQITKTLHNTQYLFTSGVTETHYHRGIANDWLNSFWKKHDAQLKELGLHYISPHGFRHSQATLLYELGVDPKDAQHRLRHKNIKTTMDIYTHLTEDRDKLTANKLNSFQARDGKTDGKIVNLSDYTL